MISNDIVNQRLCSSSSYVSSSNNNNNNTVNGGTRIVPTDSIINNSRVSISSNSDDSTNVRMGIASSTITSSNISKRQNNVFNGNVRLQQQQQQRGTGSSQDGGDFLLGNASSRTAVNGPITTSPAINSLTTVGAGGVDSINHGAVDVVQLQGCVNGVNSQSGDSEVMTMENVSDRFKRARARFSSPAAPGNGGAESISTSSRECKGSINSELCSASKHVSSRANVGSITSPTDPALTASGESESKCSFAPISSLFAAAERQQISKFVVDENYQRRDRQELINMFRRNESADVDEACSSNYQIDIEPQAQPSLSSPPVTKKSRIIPVKTSETNKTDTSKPFATHRANTFKAHGHVSASSGNRQLTKNVNIDSIRQANAIDLSAKHHANDFNGSGETTKHSADRISVDHCEFDDGVGDGALEEAGSVVSTNSSLNDFLDKAGGRHDCSSSSGAVTGEYHITYFLCYSGFICE